MQSELIFPGSYYVSEGEHTLLAGCPPEIVKVLLFGSLVQGNWTADSDADLIVVVRREFPDFLTSRAPYQVFTPAIPTDSLVYSEREFGQLSADQESFLARNLLSAVEL